LSTRGERAGEEAPPEEEPGRGFYTLSEGVRLLRAPVRSVLEWLETGEIEAELHSCGGRWRISNSLLKGFGAVGRTEEEFAWRYEKEHLLTELYAERERANRERDRAVRQHGKVDREQYQAERSRRELKIERMKGSRREEGVANR
jgi:hypothetical protein